MDRYLESFKDWYASLPVHTSSGGPARGTIGAALVVLERLKEDYDLNLESHRAPGASQIRGASGAAVSKILARFGETRPFLKEGGRTNRGGPGDISRMLEALRDLELEIKPIDERGEILSSFQSFLVDRVRDFHNRERIKFSYDPSKSTWQSIHELLAQARETGKEGPFAQYLVGAKLRLRFPNEKISNESYSTADDQLGRPGDFYVGDTAFHVTVAPMQGVYNKCLSNLDSGFRTYLIVPDRWVVGTKQNAEATAPGKIAVESIESFVAHNIEEISIFSKDKLISGFGRLLETYNQRVDEVEIDKSLLIEIPQNLRFKYNTTKSDTDIPFVAENNEETKA